MLADSELLQRKKETLQKHNEEANRLVRESIETALILLMKERTFQAISITDIVTRAGVSRSGYYRNYSSKEDILRSIFNQSVDTILEAIRFPLRQIDAENTYLQLFQAVQKNIRLFEIVQKAEMQWMFLSEVSKHLSLRIPEEQTSAQYWLCSWVGATVNVIFLWVGRGMKESPTEMAAICAHEVRGQVSVCLVEG